jgi:hypothetical protein
MKRQHRTTKDPGEGSRQAAVKILDKGVVDLSTLVHVIYEFHKPEHKDGPAVLVPVPAPTLVPQCALAARPPTGCAACQHCAREV